VSDSLWELESALPDPLPDGWRELAHRRSSGLEVRLLWNSMQDAVWVEVLDYAGERQLTFNPPKAKALQAFHHPFAMATELCDLARYPLAS
jgi:hypothetical protein